MERRPWVLSVLLFKPCTRRGPSQGPAAAAESPDLSHLEMGSVREPQLLERLRGRPLATCNFLLSSSALKTQLAQLHHSQAPATAPGSRTAWQLVSGQVHEPPSHVWAAQSLLRMGGWDPGLARAERPHSWSSRGRPAPHCSLGRDSPGREVGGRLPTISSLRRETVRPWEVPHLRNHFTLSN